METMTINNLALELGADKRTLKKLLANTKPKRRGRYKTYPLETARKLLQDHRARRQATSEGQKEILALKAEKLRIEIGLLKEKYIDREFLAGKLSEMCVGVRGILLQALTVQLPAEAAGLGPDQLREWAEKHFNRIMCEFQDFGKKWADDDDGEKLQPK